MFLRLSKKWARDLEAGCEILRLNMGNSFMGNIWLEEKQEEGKDRKRTAFQNYLFYLGIRKEF